jgi:hypothetical protein
MDLANFGERFAHTDLLMLRGNFCAKILPISGTGKWGVFSA